MALKSREREGAVTGIRHALAGMGGIPGSGFKGVGETGRTESVWKWCLGWRVEGEGRCRGGTGPCEPAGAAPLGLARSPRERQSPAAPRSLRPGRARSLQQSEGLLTAGALTAGCGQISRFAFSC